MQLLHFKKTLQIKVMTSYKFRLKCTFPPQCVYSALCSSLAEQKVSRNRVVNEATFFSSLAESTLNNVSTFTLKLSVKVSLLHFRFRQKSLGDYRVLSKTVNF